MNLQNYYTERESHIRFSRTQASNFAKHIAGDFNPIHDAENKSFCVPGDLLFALVLQKYGLSQKMCFDFSGMVRDGVDLLFPDSALDTFIISDDNSKPYLSIRRQGEISHDQCLIDQLTKIYVEFSAQNFPHILVPLMAEKKVMVNPNRPLVIYKSMVIEMDKMTGKNINLELNNAHLQVDGKRGDVCLEFRLMDSGKLVGKGEKNMVLSGLRDYEQTAIEKLVDDYIAHKKLFQKCNYNAIKV